MPTRQLRQAREGRKVPTGVAIRDPREQLFDAAERILLRDGPNALTSRAVTTEAGFAKGVLHRHFADFDAFLAELVASRIARIEHQAVALRDSAGTGTVAGNLTGALTDLFGSVAVAIVALIISRDNLRARLRRATPDGPVRLRPRRASGVPLLAEATAMIASYLTVERDLGRIAADTDVDALAPMLIGAGHLLFAARDGTPPEHAAVAKVVAAAIASVVPEPPP
jgi:AcrR family transcriptional regulator